MATAVTATTARARPAARAETVISDKAWAGEDRYRMIAEAAYFRAEQRGFVAGSELGDWLAAEIEVDDLLAAANTPDGG
ncbi:MAG: DUF2934 domain-containing protein [Gammaproteobacteria bacterium]